MDEQMIELIARAIYAAEWANTPDPNGGYDGYVAEYCGDENPYLELARAAHSVMAGKVAELERLPWLIEGQRTAAPDCAREDGWNDALDRAAAMVRDDLGRSPDGSGHSAEPEPCFTVSAGTASVPNADIAATVADQYAAALASLGRLDHERAQVQRDLRKWKTVAELLGVELPAQVSQQEGTAAAIIADMLKAAGPDGATVTELRPLVNAAYGGVLHEKTVGVALYRMSRAGTAKRKGRRWFYKAAA